MIKNREGEGSFKGFVFSFFSEEDLQLFDPHLGQMSLSGFEDAASVLLSNNTCIINNTSTVPIIINMINTIINNINIIINIINDNNINIYQTWMCLNNSANFEESYLIGGIQQEDNVVHL